MDWMRRNDHVLQAGTEAAQRGRTPWERRIFARERVARLFAADRFILTMEALASLTDAACEIAEIEAAS